MSESSAPHKMSNEDRLKLMRTANPGAEITATPAPAIMVDLVGGPCDGSKLAIRPQDKDRGMLRIACARTIASIDSAATDNDQQANFTFGLTTDHYYLRRPDGKYEWDGECR